MKMIEQVGHLRRPHAVVAAQRVREHQHRPATLTFKPVKQARVIDPDERHRYFFLPVFDLWADDLWADDLWAGEGRPELRRPGPVRPGGPERPEASKALRNSSTAPR